MARWPGIIAAGVFGGNGTSTIKSYPSTNQIGADWIGSLGDNGAGNLQVNIHSAQQLVMPATNILHLTLEHTANVSCQADNVSTSRVDMRSYNSLGTATDPGRYHLILADFNGT